jgi:hypothetical protein
MSSNENLGLPEALEQAASALSSHADDIRPANGDPLALLGLLSADAAGEVLAWLLSHAPAAGEELATGWADEGERGAEAVLSVAADSIPKAGRKVLRRAQHRLRSRGVAAVDAGPVALVATLPKVDDAIAAALVSGFDPRGARAVYLVESNPSGGARLFAIVLDDGQGILECEAFETTRSNARRFLREAASRDQFPTCDVSVDVARALVDRAAAAQSPDRALPRAFSEWRSRSGDGTETIPLPGAQARRALGGTLPEGSLEHAVTLVREGKLGPWPPGPEALHSVAEEIGKLREQRIILSGSARREQIHTILEDALSASFGEDFAAIAAHRFEETAYLKWKAGEVEGAEACLAAADAFRAAPPTENPVARAMLEVVVAPILKQMDEDEPEEEPEQESLLVEP